MNFTDEQKDAMRYICGMLYNCVANMDVVACKEHGQAVFVDDVLQNIEDLKRSIKWL